jgi:hypothetical protein
MRSETSSIWPPKLSPICGSQRTIIHASCPQSRTSELDQDQPAVSRNLHKNRGETEEMLVSVVFGTAVLIASLMSVSLIPTPRAISKDPAKSWNTKGEKKKYLGRASSNVVLSPVRGLHRWPNRQGSENLAEEAIHYWLISGEVVLGCVWLCQCS